MPSRNRAVHVAAVSMDGVRASDPDERIACALERLEWASCRTPDVACLPEAFAGRVEPVPGPLSGRLGAWAREKSCYLVAPYHVQDAGRRYNSAVVFNRSGALMGRYDKIHPTERELDEGVCPGRTKAPLFEADFGSFGIQICFDVNWIDTWRDLRRRGADLIFFPAAYPAARHLSVLARTNRCYVVSSTGSRPASIFDVTGRVMASSGLFQPWVDATIHLSKKVFEIDFHVAKIREAERKYGRRLLVEWYHDEDQFTLASLDPELAVEDVIDEFGLVPLDRYLARCEQAQDTARRSGPQVQSPSGPCCG